MSCLPLKQTENERPINLIFNSENITLVEKKAREK